MKQQTKCPHCKKTNVVKRGTFETKAHGKQQRYFCKSCNKKFIKQTAFYRMRNSPQKITLCLDLFFRGVSLRKVQEHLQAFYPHNSSHVSIYAWIVEYSNMIGKYTDTLKLDVGKEIQVDEMEYKTKGSQSWFIDCIDTKTRFMVSSDFVKSRGLENLRKVLKNAKYKTENQVEVVTTDGLTAYRKVVKKSFYTYKKKINHNVVTASKGQGFNHKIERLHNSIRERTKTFRGFGSLEGAKAIMKGYGVYYNFIRKHQAIGKCPYELAIPEMELGVNKWLDLITLAF